jgi:hypothetical protein
MGGWMAGKAGLSIAYSNQKEIFEFVSKQFSSKIYSWIWCANE